MTARGHVRGLARLTQRLQIDGRLDELLTAGGEEVRRQAEAELKALGSASAEEIAEHLSVAVSGNRAVIGTDHPAAAATEFGSLHRPARPWLQPAFEAALPAVRAALIQALRRRLAGQMRENT